MSRISITHASRAVLVTCFALAAVGCATCPERAPVAAPAPTPVAAPAPAPAPLPVVAEPAPAPPDVVGFWAEYWAPAGRAETQRYVFLADGRFGWLAPVRDTPKVDPVQRSGHFAIEGSDLVLSVEQQRFGDGRNDQLAAPLRMPLEIGECPPNQEAQALDTAYVCLSIGGRAFWRRAPVGDATSQDPAPYLK